MQLHTFDNTVTLNQQFAQQLAAILRAAIQKRGQAFMVVSGGTTPVGLFQQLAQLELPWERVTITLADERQIATTDNDSNEQLVRKHLLQSYAANANFISLVNDEVPLAKIEAKLAALPTFDVVILGLGEDGHTASLFPCSQEITVGLDDATLSALIEVSPLKAPYRRLSLTKTRLLDSHHIFLHLTGAKKLTVLHQAVTDTNSNSLPISAFLHHPAPEMQVMFSP